MPADNVFSLAQRLNAKSSASSSDDPVRKSRQAAFFAELQASYSLIGDLFEQGLLAADDYLFQMGNRAETSESQVLYHNAMRELRLQQRQIVERLQETIRQRYAKVTDLSQTVTKASVELSVLTDSDLEQQLAIETFSNRIQVHCADWEALHDQVQQIELDLRTLKLHPKSIGQLIWDTLPDKGFDAELRLALLKLMDEPAKKLLSQLYAKLSDTLTACGVEVQAERARKKQQESKAQTPVPDESTDAAKFDFTLLRQLLGAKGGNASAEGGRDANAPRFGSGQATQLVDAIDQVQGEEPTAGVELKTWTREQVEKILPQAQNPIDADTIQLVAMIFDKILDDPQVSIYMKQQVARLQIPYIRLALSESALFDNEDHAARKLLNLMGDIARAWYETVSLFKDPVYRLIDTIVKKINQYYHDDSIVFEKAWVALSEYYDRQLSKQRQYQQRLLTAEEARARSELSRERAGRFLSNVLDQGLVPPFVKEMLNTRWYAFMRAVYLKYGEGSEWQNSAKIATELVWSVQPGIATTSSERFNQILPRVLSSLRKGLIAIRVSQDEINRFMDRLARIHNAELGRHDSQPDARMATYHERLTREMEDISRTGLVDEPRPDDNSSVRVTLNERLMDEEYWYELDLSAQETVRCRLGGVVMNGAKFILISYTGEKLAERSWMGLKLAIEQGKLRKLDNQPILDKSIGILVEELEHLQAS